MRTKTRPFAITIALILTLSCSPPAAADLVLQCNLLRLHKSAGTILHGRCIAKTEHPDAQPWPYVEYTFEVVEAVKGCRDRHGALTRTVTFRHVADLPERLLSNGGKAAARRFGVPQYDVGDEKLLFLTRESRRGLCAPVGLEQGAFAVERRGRRTFVRNPLKNHGLLERVSENAFERLSAGALRRAREAGASLELETLLELCRRVRS